MRGKRGRRKRRWEGKEKKNKKIGKKRRGKIPNSTIKKMKEENENDI